ncbi:MAG: SCO1664 family protein [Chloroflexi bacterium]|nr:SCO1664 family protein [Chloroflexota bacterium]
MATSTDAGSNAPQPPQPPQPAGELDALSRGTIIVRGLFEFGSNYTFLCEVRPPGADTPLRAVYKPAQGEQPLWDFESGSLARREVAAYLVSQALGWDLIPPTVLRLDGPYGEGSLQAYRDLDLEQDYFSVRETAADDLRQVAAFDALANNADRKAGHLARDREGHLWLIDHGLCFHAEPKLRTVIWDFAGEEIPPALVADMKQLGARLKGDALLRQGLSELLTPQEVTALSRRVHRLVRQPRFPLPGSGRSVPWPIWV